VRCNDKLVLNQNLKMSKLIVRNIRMSTSDC